ncbi:glycoside hydrolase 100 family protein [Allocoleopsis franciscana]|uniref:beta-fructofuranosidase n=1 Tax=Allocoleopsis franciscana PCC 7113 TaxID=1173027 RepID=K9WBI0_9CYAN|nr:glycoside hydrolase 100 family protein [Allocoleopsis franciscana]AFZ17568.1 glycogen debranching enzyme [Allocoleopsis franciscana PCC 7113]
MNSRIVEEAQARLKQSIMTYQQQPVGTVAAKEDVLEEEQLNYGHCFVRDFVPSGLAFLMQGEREIVRNFLEFTLALQSDRAGLKKGQGLFGEVRQHWQGKELLIDGIRLGEGLMPASFEVTSNQEIEPDFGQRAIGRVTPVDSGLWWIILLRAYEKACQIANRPEEKIAHRIEFQRGIQLILDICLSKRFDMTPTMLVPEAAFMIDRRMGVYGHPLEIQSLFHHALRAARYELLVNESYIEKREVDSRLPLLTKYIRERYWLDPKRVRAIYRYQTEEFGETALNKFNIYENSVPEWVLPWVDRKGGYLVGNLGVGWIDFRFFSQGNLLSIISGLATPEQSNSIMHLIELQWSKLMGNMPMKLCYPALEERDWESITGCDPKNVPWSYHNGGSWPVLLWSLTAAALKTKKIEIAERAIQQAEHYLLDDEWPEYYDGKNGDVIGREARLYQTWTIAGYLVAKYLIQDRDHLKLITFGDEPELGEE